MRDGKPRVFKVDGKALRGLKDSRVATGVCYYADGESAFSIAPEARNSFQAKGPYMAACKFTPTLTIKKSALPVTCKLQNPPSGVTIAKAQLLDKSGIATDLKVSNDGQSFVIPNSIIAGDWTLAVRVQGGKDPIPSVYLVEDCDASQRILVITDPVAKAAIAEIAVVLK